LKRQRLKQRIEERNSLSLPIISHETPLLLELLIAAQRR
jgi:hypothetical protein